jgi:WD40 repeat protein
MDTFGYLRQILIRNTDSGSCDSPDQMPLSKSPYMTPPSSGCKNDSGPPIEWGKLFEGIAETIAISPNKNNIFIGGRNGIMKQFDINKRALKRDWKQIHKGAIYSIQITSDSQNVITCGKDSYIRYWHISKGLLVNEMRTTLTGVIMKSSALSKDDMHLFTGGSDCLLKKWTIHKSDYSPSTKNPRMPNWECVEYPAVHKNPITMVKLSPDGAHVLSISDDEFLVKWKVGAFSEEDCFFKIGSVSKDGITNMEISADGKWVLVTGFDNKLKQIDMESGLVVKDYGVIHGDQITKIILTEGKIFYPLTYRLELFVQLWGRWLDEAMGYC